MSNPPSGGGVVTTHEGTPLLLSLQLQQHPRIPTTASASACTAASSSCDADNPRDEQHDVPISSSSSSSSSSSAAAAAAAAAAATPSDIDTRRELLRHGEICEDAATNDPYHDPPQQQQPQQHHQQRQQGQASLIETVLNQMKTCMGTGTLALSYSCQQSGLAVFVGGMVVIALWNVHCTGRLVRCLRYLPHYEEEELGNELLEEKARCRSVSDDDGAEQTRTTIEAAWQGPAREEEEVEGGRGADGAMNADDDDARKPQQQGLLPPPGTSQLGQVAFAAFGNPGLQVLDLLMVLLLHGIIVSYVCAAVSFLNDTDLVPILLRFVFDVEPDPLGHDGGGAMREWTTALNAALSATLMWTMSLVPDMGHLSRASAVGLSVLLATFVVIAGYGVVFRNATTTTSHSTTATIPMFPASPVGLARWFGVVVFSMGTVPLTYNFRQSMREPREVMKSTRVALALVAVLYLAMGIGLLMLFPDLTGDVLHELPVVSLAGSTKSEASSSSSLQWIGHAIIPLLARLAMVSVVIMTAPLLVVPCGELVEGKLFHHYQRHVVRQYQQQQQQHVLHHHHHHHHRSWIAVTRAVICGLCAVIATAFPSFVQVLSVVGSACVGTVSFVLPPLFHCRLLVLHRQAASNHADKRVGGAPPAMADPHGPVVVAAWRGAACVDVCMIGIGMTATILATVLSIRG
jgi:amino acid permease